MLEVSSSHQIEQLAVIGGALGLWALGGIAYFIIGDLTASRPHRRRARR